MNNPAVPQTMCLFECEKQITECSFPGDYRRWFLAGWSMLLEIVVDWCGWPESNRHGIAAFGF